MLECVSNESFMYTKSYFLSLLKQSKEIVFIQFFLSPLIMYIRFHFISFFALLFSFFFFLHRCLKIYCFIRLWFFSLFSYFLLNMSNVFRLTQDKRMKLRERKRENMNHNRRGEEMPKNIFIAFNCVIFAFCVKMQWENSTMNERKVFIVEIEGKKFTTADCCSSLAPTLSFLWIIIKQQGIFYRARVKSCFEMDNDMEEMNDYLRLSIMENNINNNQRERGEGKKCGSEVETKKIFKRYLFHNNDLFLLV